jgi:hypothetical protein
LTANNSPFTAAPIANQSLLPRIILQENAFITGLFVSTIEDNLENRKKGDKRAFSPRPKKDKFMPRRPFLPGYYFIELCVQHPILVSFEVHEPSLALEEKLEW